MPIIILSGFIVKNLNINISKKKYLVVLMLFILLLQNLIKDNSWHLNDQRYNMKNAMDFSKKIKNNFVSEIIGPAILLDESGKPKKVNNRNDMFFFSYSPLLCYQPIFGYGLGKLNAEKITFNSKAILEDKSLLYYSDKLDNKNGNLMFFNPSCFLYPEENDCQPGDTFKISEKEKLIQFTNYNKFEFKLSKVQIFSNYVSLITFVMILFYLLYCLIIFVYDHKRKY